ncbi:alpha/beta fold hydrolase [Puia dinghuensis]|uniref:Hydrolase n=1 Tax=Puia dinghuensis TaxID=1792502 RepID=A0A8J2UID4_9BACT|nr:alpha/beta hydrolase [Puia dinghuensis]GGB20354.1 hydrolase [Puia dinghuensis]
MNTQTFRYKYIPVDGLSIFYREAGEPGRQTILLLNGVPNASGAFQELMNDLKEEFHLIAPDFPGFGNSEAPDKTRYDYSFHNLSVTIEHFMDQLGLQHSHVYALGYGGPIAFRIALRRPKLFASFILQNSNAYEEGLGPAMHDAAPYLSNRNSETEKLVKPLLTLDGIKLFFLNGAKDQQAVNPDHYHDALYYLSRPGQQDIQLDLLYDYRNNLAEYPKWQQWLKTTQPRMLLVWGRNDVFFPVSAAEAIKRDVPGAELHVYDTSHLALEEFHLEIAKNIHAFLNN